MKKVLLSVAAIALVFLSVEGGMSEENQIGPGAEMRLLGPATRTMEATNQPKTLSKKEIEKIQKDNIDLLNEKLSGVKNLTNTEKADFIKVFIANWPQGFDLKDKRHTGTVMFFQRLADHPKLKMEQKVLILKNYLDKNKKNMGRLPLKALKGKPNGKK